MAFVARRAMRLIAGVSLAAVLVTSGGCGEDRSASQTGSAMPSPTSTASPSPTLSARGVTLTILGTNGGPFATPDRNGISSLLTVNGANYLIDSGVGTTRQLAAVGLTPPAIRAVFITHLHDDHTADLPVWLSFRFTTAVSQPLDKLVLVGPPGTQAFTEGVNHLLEVNGSVRQAEGDGGTLRPSDMIDSRTVEPGLVYEDANIRVTAVENTHYLDRGVQRPAGSLSYSYRVEAPGRAICFTGDTGPSAAVAQLASGATILVAEMVSDDGSDLPPGFTPQLAQRGHLSPLQVGELAASAHVGTLVLSHYNRATEADLQTIAGVFSGKIVAGKDLMRF